MRDLSRDHTPPPSRYSLVLCIYIAHTTRHTSCLYTLCLFIDLFYNRWFYILYTVESTASILCSSYYMLLNVFTCIVDLLLQYNMS